MTTEPPSSQTGQPQEPSKHKSAGVYSTLLLLVGIGCASWASWQIISHSLGLRHRFGELGLNLPALTSFALSPAFGLVLPVIALICLAKEPFIRNRRIKALLNGLFVMAVLGVFVTWRMLAVQIPLTAFQSGS